MGLLAKSSGLVGLSPVLGRVLDQAGLGHVIHEDRLRRHWQEVMGPRAAHLAHLDTLKDFKLRIRVESAAWRMDLHFQKDEILQRANSILGSNLVKEIILA